MHVTWYVCTCHDAYGIAYDSMISIWYEHHIHMICIWYMDLLCHDMLWHAMINRPSGTLTWQSNNPHIACSIRKTSSMCPFPLTMFVNRSTMILHAGLGWYQWIVTIRHQLIQMSTDMLNPTWGWSPYSIMVQFNIRINSGSCCFIQFNTYYNCARNIRTLCM